MKTDGQGSDPDAAERLLDGVSGDPRTTPEPLAGLLAAASAPARESELTGEEAAVAAFHAASSLRASSPREAGRVWFTLVRLLPAKIAAVALATATAAGGVALASRAGGLPTGDGTARHGSSSSPPGSSRTSVRPDVEPGQKPTSRSARPSPSTLAGLCRAYTTTAPAQRAQALTRPALRALVDAAGGAAKVPAYCAALSPSPRKTPKADGSTTGTDGGKQKSTTSKGKPGKKSGKHGDDAGNGGGSTGDDQGDDDGDEEGGGDGDKQGVPKNGNSGDGGSGGKRKVTDDPAQPQETSGTPTSGSAASGSGS